MAAGTRAVAAAGPACRGRRACLGVLGELAESNGAIQLADALRSKALAYLSFIEGLQLSAEGDDHGISDRTCAASAIFLAMYERASRDGEKTPPAESATTGAGHESFRLGDLLRHCKTGVRDFMEHLTLVASRLDQPLSDRLQADLRVMKEGVVVTKMIHGKYMQLWNERESLLPSAVPRLGAKSSAAGANGVSPSTRGSGVADNEAPRLPYADPGALPRLGWCLYLLTKEVLGFPSSNAAFVRCLTLALGALGALVWNSSTRWHRASSVDGAGTPTAAAADAEYTGSPRKVIKRTRARDSDTAGGAGDAGHYDSEAALLAALSASGRCPSDDVGAMSARVVEVMEVLLEEGVILSHHSAYSSPTAATARKAATFPAADATPAKKGGGRRAGGRQDANQATAAAYREDDHGEEKAAKTNADVGVASAVRSQSLDTRAERVAGIFHPSVATENAGRLDACYWARVAGRAAGRGVGVLDETFVLTASLRDTAGTPRYGRSTPRRAPLTPSVSRASRQLFQDYQKASASVTKHSSADALSGIGMPLASPANGPTFDNAAHELPGAKWSTGTAAGSGGSAFGMLEIPPGVDVGAGSCGSVVGHSIAEGPAESRVMAVVETVRWLAQLETTRSGPPPSLLEKLERCATALPTTIERRVAAHMKNIEEVASGQSAQKENVRGTRSRGSPGGGRLVEASVLKEAKGKAEALYYVTLEALLDAETRRLGAEDHSRLLRQETLHAALLACCLEAVFKASSLLSLTFPWVLRRIGVGALDLCKMLESFARFCPGLPMNLKYHLFEVQTEIVERLALEDGAGVFRLIREHKAAGEWPVPALRETNVAPPTGSRLAVLPSPQRRQLQEDSPPPASAATRSHSNGPADNGRALGAETSTSTATATATARASTLDLYFRKLIQRAAEVVAELCLTRLRLPGDTADQVWTVMKRCVAQRTEMLKDRHLHQVVLCSVCKVNSVTPEVTFKRIIEHYKQLAGAGGALGGGVGTPRLSVIKDILLKPASVGAREGSHEQRGDIIKFYNQVYIPAMKQFVLEFKNLAGQQQGVASITTAQDAARVAERVLSKRSAGGAFPLRTSASSERRWQAGAAVSNARDEDSSSQRHRRRCKTRSGGARPTPERPEVMRDHDEVQGSGDAPGSAAHQSDVVAADVVAAGAALSALSAAPHPQTPLVSHLPSQRMASPKRVQENVFLTTVTTPARAGSGAGFERPTRSAASSPRSGVGNGGSRSTESTRPPRGRNGQGGGSAPHRGGAPGASGTGGAMYAFGESPSKDLQAINRTVRVVEEGSPAPHSRSKRTREPSALPPPPR